MAQKLDSGYDCSGDVTQTKQLKLREFWINVYPHHNAMSVFTSKEQADENASPDRVECIKVGEYFSICKYGYNRE